MAYVLKMYREFPSMNFTRVKLCSLVWGSGLTPKSWTIEKCSSAQVKGAEGNEEEIQRGANHRDTERGAGQWSQSNLRQAQHQRGDLLQLEAQVWRDGGSPGAALKCARGCERAIKTAGSRPVESR